MGSSQVSLEILRELVQYPQIKVKTVWSNAPRPSGRGRSLQGTPVSDWVKTRSDIELREPERIDAGEIDYLYTHPLDFILVAAYGHILPAEWLTLPRLGCFNIHFSLLPQYRGASPIQAAILQGDAETGITIQKIHEKLDTGDIVISRSFPLTGLNAPQALVESLRKVKSVLPEFIRQLIEGELRCTPQNSSQGGRYCRKIKKSDGLIRPPMTVTEIYRKFLAYQPWPGIFFQIQKHTFTIKGVETDPDIYAEFQTQYGDRIEALPDNGLGLFHLSAPSRLLLATRKTDPDSPTSSPMEFLNLTCIQKSGKKPLPVKDFLNGVKWDFPIIL